MVKQKHGNALPAVILSIPCLVLPEMASFLLQAL